MNDNFRKSLQFAKDQLVVDLEYQDLVVNFLLYGVQIPMVKRVDENKTLGLALLELDGVVTSAARIEAARPQDIASLRTKLGTYYYESIDTVLFELRDQLSNRFGGWLPEFGKNRDTGVVFSTPGTQGGPLAGFDLPVVPYDNPTWNRVATQANPGTLSDTKAGAGVRIGVLDTRRYRSTPEGDWTSNGEVLKKESALKSPWAGHGTFVAGLIRAQAPAAHLVDQQLLDDDNAWATGWATATKLAWFADHPVDILNLSFACRTTDGRPPLLIVRAMEKLLHKTVVVAAAGNHGADDDQPNAPMWPAALPGVVAVGARTSPRAPAAFSPKLPWITFLADGVNVLSTYPSAQVPVLDSAGHVVKTLEFTGFARWSGTSFAAATVSGAIAARTDPEKTAWDALNDLRDGSYPAVEKYLWQDGAAGV